MRFFFYGTLIAREGEPAPPGLNGLHARLRPLGPGMTRGRLYAIAHPLGWYPALVSGGGEVHGMIYEAMHGFARQDLAAMDAYEDCDPGAVALSLYRRVLVPMRGQGDARLRAMAYVFNRPLPAGSQRIADGDFRAWLARTGHRAFRG